MQKDIQPLLYTELAQWFHLLTAPEDYREEAAFYSQLLLDTANIPVQEVLELDSGGGNNASHMKAHFTLTLTDLSEDMLVISRELNPECEHLRGDMRNMRLDRTFDAVFVHDAISYMTTETDLKSVMDTAFIHCRPGGAVLFCPDFVRETFSDYTDHGGHDDGNRGMRYLEWAHDPDPDDTSYVVDFAYLLREDDNVRSCSDAHQLGLFPEATWLELMRQTGFVAVKTPHYPHRDDKYWATPVFAGVRP